MLILHLLQALFSVHSESIFFKIAGVAAAIRASQTRKDAALLRTALMPKLRCTPLAAIASVLQNASVLGGCLFAIQHSRRRPRTACGAQGRIDSAARRRPRRARRPRASPLCSRSRPQGRVEQCRTRTTLFVEAVQRARSQVLCLSNNKLSSQALRSPRPAGAKRW